MLDSITSTATTYSAPRASGCPVKPRWAQPSSLGAGSLIVLVEESDELYNRFHQPLRAVCVQPQGPCMVAGRPATVTVTGTSPHARWPARPPLGSPIPAPTPP